MQEAKEKGESFFIELYEVELRTSMLYVAACDEDIVFAGKTFKAIPFKRDSVTRSMDSICNECEIELGDCSDELLSFVMNGFDFRGCKATIVRIMYPESLTDSNNWSWIFSGEIDAPSFSNGVFKCKIVNKFPNIEAPNRDFQIACNSEFGDEECTMSKGTTKLVVSPGTGNVIHLGVGYADDYWIHGSITIGGEAREIIKSSGSDITVNANFLQSISGKEAELIRGCDKTNKTCKKMGNERHYSGFPAIPFECEYR